MSDDVEIGIDEAGLGTWAGPLVAAVVVFPTGTSITGLRDSKKMTKMRREDMVDTIFDRAVYFKVGLAAADEMDRGYGKAWQRLLRQLAEGAHAQYPTNKIIVDGNTLVRGASYCESIPKADDRYMCVSAASVLAKYSQNMIMEELEEQYPQYSFNTHCGYGTKLHISEIEKNGLCAAHRKSIRRFKDYV